jgi:hypothetical protein
MENKGNWGGDIKKRDVSGARRDSLICVSPWAAKLHRLLSWQLILSC